ncbi:hypothetical protein F8388_011334 [Cannabis sativa]|uniref:Ubiquitin-like protease family profile domain-containing protein n=1 Tax=Cannabis sativa TaxID=3483 RepID=A0A7J6FCZ4_CANSA|nr:hypothetical protein F8388_011334 [Cannabis sativa]
MEDPDYRAKNPHTLMYPTSIYPDITQPVWQNFVASPTTPEFQLRRLQQARRAANDNSHRLGRKGYPNLEYEFGLLNPMDVYELEDIMLDLEIVFQSQKVKRTNDIENNFKAVLKALEEKSHGHQDLSTDIEAHFSSNIVQEREYEDIANDQATRCVLLDSIHRTVSKGIIRQATEVHNKLLEENDYRIEVNELLIPDALIPNAIDLDEIHLVKHPQLLATILGRTPDDRARDLAIGLGEIISGQLLMAALNDGHWIFLFIDISKEIVYFFDPLGGYIPQDCKNVPRIFVASASVYMLHNLAKGKRMKQDSLQWYNVKCPQQQDLKICGFYVCAMLRDLVFEPQPSSYINSKCNNQEFYSKDQLNVVRREKIDHEDDSKLSEELDLKEESETREGLDLIAEVLAEENDTQEVEDIEIDLKSDTISKTKLDWAKEVEAKEHDGSNKEKF